MKVGYHLPLSLSCTHTHTYSHPFPSLRDCETKGEEEEQSERTTMTSSAPVAGEQNGKVEKVASFPGLSQSFWSRADRMLLLHYGCLV